LLGGSCHDDGSSIVGRPFVRACWALAGEWSQFGFSVSNKLSRSNWWLSCRRWSSANRCARFGSRIAVISPNATALEQLNYALLPSLEHFRSLAHWSAFAGAFAETALMVCLPVPLGALTFPGFAAESSGDSNRSNHVLDAIAVRRWPDLGRSPRLYFCLGVMSVKN
jgi:hypothetical protein